MIYFDNAATTPLNKKVKDLIANSLDCFANPTSGYGLARKEYFKIEEAKKTILQKLKANPNDYKIYFTSGATESNNWVIDSVAKDYKGTYKNKIVSTSIEHPSVYNKLKALEKEGFDVVYVKPQDNGVVNVEDIENAIDERTILVSVMAVNNQIGTKQPIEKIGRLCKERNVQFHSDFTQAIGHIPIDVEKFNLDFLTASAHKFGGMKGVGFVILKKDYTMNNLLYGGSAVVRSGTLNTLGITTTSLALSEAVDNETNNQMVTGKLKKYLISELLYIGIDFDLNSPPIDTVNNIVNISFHNIDGELLKTYLEAQNILVSTTSACETGIEITNRILEEINVPREYIKGTIRLSFSPENTFSECDNFINAIKNFLGGN